MVFFFNLMCTHPNTIQKKEQSTAYAFQGDARWLKTLSKVNCLRNFPLPLFTREQLYRRKMIV